MPFRIEKLEKHDRSAFDCGTEVLNRYLQRQAGQDQRKRVAVCFVAVDDESETIAGFYTLSSGSLDLDRLPEALKNKLPRYQVVPVVVMGRLAVATSAQGLGLARALLFDATEKVETLNVGAFALLVDAKDEETEAFYLHHGFMKLESRDDDERTLVMPIAR
ncbi:MAG: GNAT family N-acetyltransferase [Planctomycetota bacterium]